MDRFEQYDQSKTLVPFLQTNFNDSFDSQSFNNFPNNNINDDDDLNKISQSSQSILLFSSQESGYESQSQQNRNNEINESDTVLSQSIYYNDDDDDDGIFDKSFKQNYSINNNYVDDSRYKEIDDLDCLSQIIKAFSFGNFDNDDFTRQKQRQQQQENEVSSSNQFNDNRDSNTGVDDFNYNDDLDDNVIDLNCSDYMKNKHFFDEVSIVKQKQPKIIENFQNYVDKNFNSNCIEEEGIIKKLNMMKEKILKRNQQNKSTTTDNNGERNRIVKSKRKTCKLYDNIIISGKNIEFSLLYGVSLQKNPKKKFRKIRKNFKQYCSLIDKLISNLKTVNHSISPRDLYYTNKKSYRSPTIVTNLLNDICCTTNLTRIDLKVDSCSSSFVYGDLNLFNQNLKKNIYCQATPTAILIPDCLKQWTVKKTEAKFILIVEKFTIFNRLIQMGIGDKFKLIMVTGCGYPSVKARFFVQKLWFQLKLPIFALMDGDAYGIDIMLSYKYGAKQSAFQNHQIISTDIKWLGINADDINEFGLQGIHFKKNELKKFDLLKKRKDVLKNYSWLKQINLMKSNGIKVELESLLDYAPNFILECYLPYKLFNAKWI